METKTRTELVKERLASTSAKINTVQARSEKLQGEAASLKEQSRDSSPVERGRVQSALHRAGIALAPKVAINPEEKLVEVNAEIEALGIADRQLKRQADRELAELSLAMGEDDTEVDDLDKDIVAALSMLARATLERKRRADYILGQTGRLPGWQPLGERQTLEYINCFCQAYGHRYGFTNIEELAEFESG